MNYCDVIATRLHQPTAIWATVHLPVKTSKGSHEQEWIGDHIPPDSTPCVFRLMNYTYELFRRKRKYLSPYVLGCYTLYCNTIDHLLFCATATSPLRDLSCTLGMFGETTDDWITMWNPVYREYMNNYVRVMKCGIQTPSTTNHDTNIIWYLESHRCIFVIFEQLNGS